jgi:hypothetical protein
LVSQQVGTNLPRGILYGLAGRGRGLGGGGRRLTHHYYTVKTSAKHKFIYYVELDSFNFTFIDAED